MRDGSPRLWPYSPANSPIALPDRPLLCTSEEVITLLSNTKKPPFDVSLKGEQLTSYLAEFETETGSIDTLLKAQNVAVMAQRRPILLLGELANPYRLQDINIGPLPIFPVRLEGVCKTWADGLDTREAYPGVHHVTLARTPGWWEHSHVGMATVEQMKAMMAWLENGVRTSWKPVKLAEGLVRLDTQPELEPPSKADITWDGTVERVELPMPKPTGPMLDLSALMVPVHTRQGCYNHRGRLARCAHMNQRDFHDNLFRKGSSHRWNDVLTVQ
ncbi:MAG TPA: hypothetical protein QGI72_02815 [Poseidonia sp.]|nr:hypothetical protein [Poseidonia sp.]